MEPKRRNIRMLMMFNTTGMYTPETTLNLALWAGVVADEVMVPPVLPPRDSSGSDTSS